MQPVTRFTARIQKIVSLMDMALIGMKSLKKKGLIPDLDESEEINACSIQVPVTIDGKTEQWLVQFKNETHNHPTEIEPFGGAATCLGGAIRDPLSGRSLCISGYACYRLGRSDNSFQGYNARQAPFTQNYNRCRSGLQLIR